MRFGPHFFHLKDKISVYARIDQKHLSVTQKEDP